MPDFKQENIPLTLYQVKFKEPFNSVQETKCHHVINHGYYSTIHFTKSTFWEVRTRQILEIKEIENPLYFIK